MAAELSERWLALIDEAACILARLRGGSVRSELFEDTAILAEGYVAWCTDSRDAIDELALTSLATAYQFRRTFDRRSITVFRLLEEINRHVSTTL